MTREEQRNRAIKIMNDCTEHNDDLQAGIILDTEINGVVDLVFGAIFPPSEPFDPAKIAERYEGIVDYHCSFVGEYHLEHKEFFFKGRSAISELYVYRFGVNKAEMIFQIPTPETFEQFESDVFRATGVKLKRRAE